MPSSVEARDAFRSRGQEAEIHSHNLDLLRAVAVLCVLVSHVASTFGHRELGSLGRFGVNMFFFHTSFVLMQSLQRMNRTASGWRLTAGFWIRRAFRIYPLAMLVVAFTVLARVPANGVGAYATVGAGALLSNLALTQNLIYAEPVLGPLWSLPLEVQMYFLLPVAYLLVKRYRVSPAWLWLGSVVLALTLPRVNDRLGVFSVGPCFASGIVAFQLQPKSRGYLHAWTWPLILVLAALLFGPFDNVSLGQKIYLAWLVSLLIALAYIYTRDAAKTPLSRATHFLAEISYGVYLSHILVIYFAIKYLRPGVVADLAFLIGLPLISMALFKFVEQPFVAVGRLMSKRVMLLAGISTRRPEPSSTHLQASERSHAGADRAA